MSTYKLYGELADWWPLLSRPEDYDVDANCVWKLLTQAVDVPPATVLELGSGGGNTASTGNSNGRIIEVDGGFRSVAAVTYVTGDLDRNGDVDLDDYDAVRICLTGPAGINVPHARRWIPMPTGILTLWISPPSGRSSAGTRKRACNRLSHSHEKTFVKERQSSRSMSSSPSTSPIAQDDIAATPGPDRHS